MHLTNCLHPVTIIRDGKEQKVPCGHCDYCLFVRSSSMIERFKLESQCHKYAIFCTLTYADIFLPACLYSEEFKGFYVPDCDRLTHNLIGNNDEGLFCHWPYHDKKSDSVMEMLMKTHGFIPRLSRYDLQCFFKRLRINIKRQICNKLNISYEECRISYLACGEIGPTTFRPHYHFVLLFDHVKIYENFKMLLRKSWPFGSQSFRICKGSREIEYVARYCYSSNRFPSIFASKMLRAFLLVSKSEPVGMSKVSEAQIKELLASQSVLLTIHDTRTGSDRHVPIWRFLENRLYPKFTAFDRLPDWVRIRLLGCAARSQSYREFLYIVEDYLIQRYNTAVMDYFQLYCKRPVDCLDLIVKKCIDNATYSIWLAARRIMRNISLYGDFIGVYTIADYCKIIDKYYHNKEMFKLRLQMEFENSFMRDHPEWLSYIDLLSQDSHVYETSDWLDSYNTITYAFDTSHKSKAKRNYLVLHPEYRVCSSSEDFLEGLV